jgi:hypothetical protein
MTRKVYVEVKVKLLIRADDDTSIAEDVMAELDYNFTAPEGSGADIEDTEILDWEIKDSK